MANQPTPLSELPINGQRVRTLREHFGYNTQQKFAKALGVSDVAVNKWELKGATIGSKNVAKIQKLTGVSMDWLLEGIGDMLPEQTPVINRIDDIVLDNPNPVYKFATSSLQRVVTITEDEKGSPNIEMVSSRAAGSYIDNLQKPEYIRKLPKLMVPGNMFRSGIYRAFNVEGHSMEPAILNGSWVVGQYVENWLTDIKDGDTYIIVTNDSIQIKQVINRLAERGYLELRSINKEFRGGRTKMEDILEVWRWKMEMRYEIVDIYSGLTDQVRDLQSDMEVVKSKLGLI